MPISLSNSKICSGDSNVKERDYERTNKPQAGLNEYQKSRLSNAKFYNDAQLVKIVFFCPHFVQLNNIPTVFCLLRN